MKLIYLFPKDLSSLDNKLAILKGNAGYIWGKIKRFNMTLDNLVIGLIGGVVLRDFEPVYYNCTLNEVHVKRLQATTPGVQLAGFYIKMLTEGKVTG